MKYRSYKGDPRWIIARFNSFDTDGKRVKKGDRVFYYPMSGQVLSGEKAEQAARDFEAAAFDEDMMGGY